MTVIASVAQLLLESGLLDRSRLDECLAEHKETGKKLESILLERSLITVAEFNDVLSPHTGFEAIDLAAVDIPSEVISLVPEEICRKYNALPVSRTGRQLTVALADPTSELALDEMRFVTGLEIRPALCPENAIAKGLEKYFCQDAGKHLPSSAGTSLGREEAAERLGRVKDGLDAEERPYVLKPTQSSEESPVIPFLYSIIAKAFNAGASHIHLEPSEKDFHVHFRVEGVLRYKMEWPKKLFPAVCSRIKMMAGLDIAEKMLPLDGRMRVKLGNDILDIQVSTVPTLHGERFVMNIRDQIRPVRDIDSLGFLPEQLAAFKRILQLKSGLVLVTGPRDSGKRTTVYSALSFLSRRDLCILSAEETPECSLEGVAQLRIKKGLGLSYATALKSLLRQDPDVLMVQEIKDGEVGTLAVQTALDGYLVLSSLYASDAPGSLVKLIELGVQPALLGRAVRGLISQRLVRKICDNCRAEYEPSPQERDTVPMVSEALEAARASGRPAKFFKGTGCERCGGTGYSGRLLVCEILEMSDRMRAEILRNPAYGNLRETANREGMETLSQNTIRRVLGGETTIEEFLRVFLEADHL